jgi:MFS family permease
VTISQIDTGVGWSEILTREYASRLATLSLAIWLHASNSMLTATTMPSAVEDIGGLNLISWTFALYLMGSIIAGASVSLLVIKSGIRATMIRAAMVYAVGCVVCATAPSMPVILVGRVLQGLGGGGLVALVYISQDRFFPNRFVPKIVACISTVWMISAFSGPVIGGAFATLGIWRMAYWAFAFQAGLLMLAIYLLLEAESVDLELEAERIPIVRLMFLAAAILLIAMSGAEFDPLLSPVYIVLGGLAMMFFVFRDRTAKAARMLPLEATDLSHSIGNGILTTLLLCLCIMSFLVYGPFILMKLYGMTPLMAGLVVMLETLAWGTAAILFSGTDPRNEPVLIRFGSALVVVGLVAMAWLLPNGPIWGLVIVIVASSGGFGMMWGFIIKRIVGAASAAEKDRTASLLPITQQTGFALGAALSGLIANGLGISEDMGDDGLRQVAFWLFAGFIPVALIGNITAWRFVASQPVNTSNPSEE